MPPLPSPIPMWDTGLVLHEFALAPFELFLTASLAAVTYKMFVLTTLVLGARRDELCTLRSGQFIFPAEDWSFVLLYSDPSFIPNMAKRKLPTEPFKLRALPLDTPPRDDATVLVLTTDPLCVNNRETLFLPLDRTCSLSKGYFC